MKMVHVSYLGLPRTYKMQLVWLNTMGPGQNGRHFSDDIFKCLFLNENIRISIEISLKFVPRGPINNIPALSQIMAWRRSGDKPLSERCLVYWRIYASLGPDELTENWCMMTFSALLAFCAGNSSVIGEFSSRKPARRSFDAFFDLCLNKWLSKQSMDRWFEMPSRSL